MTPGKQNALTCDERLKHVKGMCVRWKTDKCESTQPLQKAHSSQYIMSSVRTPNSRAISFVTETELAEWRAEIAALPMRKRDKWHSCVDDKSGTMHRVRFHNDHFQMRMHSDRRGREMVPWVPITPMFGYPTRSQMVDAFGDSYVKGLEGSGPYDPEKLKAHGEEDPNYQRLARVRDGGDDAMMLEGTLMINESITGKHYSNKKKVKVPTAAGQPVRG